MDDSRVVQGPTCSPGGPRRTNRRPRTYNIWLHTKAEVQSPPSSYLSLSLCAPIGTYRHSCIRTVPTHPSAVARGLAREHKPLICCEPKKFAAPYPHWWPSENLAQAQALVQPASEAHNALYTRPATTRPVFVTGRGGRQAWPDFCAEFSLSAPKRVEYSTPSWICS